jgi:hypothetical protein
MYPDSGFSLLISKKDCERMKAQFALYLGNNSSSLDRK